MAALIPYIIALSAVVFYAGLSPMAKKIGYNLPPFSFIAASSFMLFCIAGSIAFVKEKDMALSSMDQIEWRGLLLFSLINLAAYALSLVALSKMPVVQYQIIGLITPIVSGLIAVFLLTEPFHARYLIALLFVAVGIFIALGPNLKGK